MSYQKLYSIYQHIVDKAVFNSETGKWKVVVPLIELRSEISSQIYQDNEGHLLSPDELNVDLIIEIKTHFDYTKEMAVYGSLTKIPEDHNNSDEEN